MCFGETGGDSLRDSDLACLRDAADRFAGYVLAARTNADDLIWAVLSAPLSSARTPRFTFCRIDPCILVMVEDQTDARRFCSAQTMEGAVEFALDVARRAILAVDNVHAAPALTQ